MEELYVLQLQGGKYYVGKTTDMNRRYEEHKKGTGSSWTSKHKPVKIVEVRALKDEHDENNTTKDLMKKYGVDNVRGGSYTQMELPKGTKNAIQAEIRGNSNACFKCGEHGHFARDCPSDEEDDDACYRCGRQGHWAEDCYAHTTVEGEYIKGKHKWRSAEWIVDSSDEEEEDDWD